MEKRRLVVVGGEIDGIMAAAAAAKENPELYIKILLSGKFLLLNKYQLAYFIQNVDEDMHSYMSGIGEEIKQHCNVEILPCRRVIDIVSLEKKVVYENLLEGYQSSLEFDKLIIAAGVKSSPPSIEGIQAGNIFFLDSIDDAYSIREGIDAGLIRKAVVVGASPLGIYVAKCLWKRGIDVTMVERGEQILDGFDAGIAQLVKKQMDQKGIKTLVGEKVLSLIGNAEGKVAEVHTPNHILAADMVIWLEDIRPNVDIAKKAGIAVGKAGAVEVDEYMETNIPGIYALGNCIQYINQITGKPIWMYNMFADRRAVRVAGYNTAGDNELVLNKGTTGALSIKAFGLNISKTGLSLAEAVQEGYQAEMATVCINDGKHGSSCRENLVKLIVNKENHRVLGVQSVGGILSEKIVDLMTAVINTGGTIEDLEQLELIGHLPHIADSHPIHIAACMIFDRLTGKTQGISAYELNKIIHDPQIVVVDVRTRPEALMGTLREAVNIPLNELEERKDQLDRQKNIVLVSNRGRRAYTGFIKLRQLGFEHLYILDGGLIAYPY